MTQEKGAKTYHFRLWKMKHIRLYSLFLVLCSLFAACEPDTACHQELGTAVQITLSADSITSAGDTAYYTQWDSITVVGIGSDIGVQGKGIKGMGLEMLDQFSLHKNCLIQTFKIPLNIILSFLWSRFSLRRRSHRIDYLRRILLLLLVLLLDLTS